MAEDEDELAFLDRIIDENNTCGASGCQTQIKRTYYCQCRKCGKAFCSTHVQPRGHDCEEIDSTRPAASHFSANAYDQRGTASAASRAKIKAALSEK